MNHRIAASSDNVVSFCRKWKITELSLFGSVLREDFRPDSDIDVLVTFVPEARWSLLDLSRMHDELSGILGRNVDLVDIKGLRNPFRRREILATKEIFYAS
ncbi:MAG TPA: DNA polymerase subunit beta [Blastocatellia bacterium]|jgi:predicted nucleotidyltransferase|nr:DNA polymerase subunit beta [Blastocatellia bacterium]HAF24689.1 DNA polymerase subunit beta [Blastocatellia bacterium]